MEARRPAGRWLHSNSGERDGGMNQGDRGGERDVRKIGCVL